MPNAKVIYNGQVLIDLTQDTVDIGNLLVGATAHDRAGNTVHGECAFDCDTSQGNATSAQLLKDAIAYSKGSPVTGTMPNNRGWSEKFTDARSYVQIPSGYHDGSGTIQLTAEEESKFIPENIRQGVTLLGIEGSMTGSEGVVSQGNVIKSASPTGDVVVVPDKGYTHLSQVTIKQILVETSKDSAGGTIVHICPPSKS